LEDGQPTDVVDMRQPVALEMEYDVLEPGFVLVPSYQFFNKQGACMFASTNPTRQARRSPIGRYTSTCWIPGNLLACGSVFATAVIGSVDPPLVHVSEHHAVAFEVRDSSPGESRRTGYSEDYPGVVYPVLEWTTNMASLPADAAILA
jgi:lipopolysaccharide transport system ATP-binding protein